MKNLANILESILFVSGDPLEEGYLLEKLSITRDELKSALLVLEKKFNKNEGIILLRFSDKVQLASNPKNSEYVSDSLNPIKQKKLSKSMLETLAIIAYKQPITKAEIESVRGVSADYAIQNLLEHDLIEVIGRKKTIGKPMLFGTTDEFLKRFDISTIDELPSYSELLEQIDLIDSNDHIYGSDESDEL